MSVVVAIKDKNRIYIGADSQCTNGNTKRSISETMNSKLWKPLNLENSLIGHVGYCRDFGLVKHKYSIAKEKIVNDLKIDFVQGEMIYDIYELLKKNNFINENDDHNMNSSFLFAHNDLLFELSNCLHVIEIEDYTAIGSGRGSALGSLMTTENENPEIRIIKAISAAANIDIFVDYPIVVSDTKTCEFKVFTKEDVKKILINYSKKRGG